MNGVAVNYLSLGFCHGWETEMISNQFDFNYFSLLLNVIEMWEPHKNGLNREYDPTGQVFISEH